MKTILGIDGALGRFTCAVISQHRDEVREAPGHAALEQGLERIDDALRAAGVVHAALDCVAVGAGPGTFTGLRIAITYAKTLALGWNLPLVAISSFDALEPDGLARPVLTVVEGRPGVISARLRTNSGERRASGKIADVLDALLEDATPKRLCVVNASEDVRAGLAERAIHVNTAQIRDPVAARAIAMLARATPPARSIHEVCPDYGEQPAARVPAQR